MLPATKKRAAKKHAPASYDAHPCVVLAIDPGKVSGWAVLARGVLTASGTARTHVDRRDAVSSATRTAHEASLPVIVVGEQWTPGGKFAGARTMAGLGAQWGLWQAAFEELAVPKRRVLRVHTQTWRAAILGGGFGVKTAEWDARAQRRASQTAGVHVDDDNEADAICIGLWAARAAKVGDVVPKRKARSEAA